MHSSKSIEMYKLTCEKLIELNPNFDKQTQFELKAIIKSDDSGEKIFERLAAYSFGKLL